MTIQKWLSSMTKEVIGSDPLTKFTTDTLTIDDSLKSYGNKHGIDGFNRFIWFSKSPDWADNQEEHDIDLARSISMSKGDVLIGLFKTKDFDDRMFFVGWEKVGRQYANIFQMGWRNNELLPGKPEERHSPTSLAELIENWTFTMDEYNNYGEIMLYSIDFQNFQKQEMFSQSMNWSRTPVRILEKLLHL